MPESNNDESTTHPRPLEQKVEQVITPFHDFVQDQTAGSMLLILCTVIALALANSMFAHDYETLVHTHAGIHLGNWSLDQSVRHWVNNGLMSLFFFVLGLEIKREILVGELQDRSRSLPMVAGAIGGMIFPTAIFFAFNAGSENVHGWGIPMATDTAFAVGILALLGRHIPAALTTFLTALAIIDDLGAILVIAVFYTEDIRIELLALAGLGLLFLTLCNILGTRRVSVYIVGGAFIWLAMLYSGVHATVAGILVAMTVPARPKRPSRWFRRKTRRLIDEFESIEKNTERPLLAEKEQHAVVEEVKDAAEKASTPLRRWERGLEQPVALLVMPIFALTNAGIPVSMDSLSHVWKDPLSLGIILGLVLGKSLGISLMVWLALRLKLGRLSEGVDMGHIIGIGLLGGMGFTMSIFIGSLGFSGSPETLVGAKTAILLASLVAGIAGYLWLRSYKSSIDYDH